MKVAGSMISPKAKRVYHKYECMYAKRIHPDNMKMMSIEEAKRREYCACKYCKGITGDLRIHKKWIAQMEKKGKIKFHYDVRTDTLYMQTLVGFWKVFLKKEAGMYLLYHRNAYVTGMPLKAAMYGDYHRQYDVKATDSLRSIVEYIVAHDRAKQIIADDYRKLPQVTKKQKRYFRKAERKERYKKAQRLDSLFMMIERQNVDRAKAAI